MSMTPSQYLTRDAQYKLRGAQADLELAHVLQDVPVAPDGWCMYVSTYGMTAHVTYSLDDSERPWKQTAMDIVTIRNNHSKRLKLRRQVLASSVGVSNRYSGEHHPDSAHTVTVTVDTGSTLPPRCTVERKLVGTTVVEQYETVVHCD